MAKKKTVPLVSVVIPTFNRGWILEEAIESVLSQDFTDYELIIVDDGSTDRTPAILDKYRDRSIVIRQNNRGVSGARNRGIAAASGHYISFLDSDDLWLPKKLSCQVDYFSAHPNAVICQTQETWIRNGVQVIPKKKHKKLSGMIFEPSLALCLVSPSAVMIRRRLFEEVGLFDENLPACEDYDLWLRISLRYPVNLIDLPLVVKRGGHPDQLSKTPGLDKFRIQSLKKIIESHPLTKNQYQAAVKTLKEKCKLYADGCLKRERKEEANYYYHLAENYAQPTEF